MKLSYKRFWSGRKSKYYPSFTTALKDAVKFASFWICVVFLFFAIINFLTNDALSWNVVLGGLLLLICIFLLGVGMFLFENYYKQQQIINAIISLLPQDCKITCIEYKEDKKQYNILTTYNHKNFVATAEYPKLWVSEKGSSDALGFLNIANNNYDDNKQLIYKFVYYVNIIALFVSYH